MGLRYVGRAPDSDASVTTKSYVDGRYATVRVDTAYINSRVATVTAAFSTQSYVDAQDALLAHKASVDTADANYVALTQKGAVNGVASLDSVSFVPAGQLPTLQSVRKVIVKNVDTTFLTSAQTFTAVAVKGFRAGTLTIADPGFPYQALVFAKVRGGSQNGTQASDSVGTGNYGQLSVLRGSDDKIFGKTITDGRKAFSHWTVLPYGQEDTTPTTYPPLIGSTQLDLWIGLYGGTTYTFAPDNFVFYALCYPVI